MKPTFVLGAVKAFSNNLFYINLRVLAWCQSSLVKCNWPLATRLRALVCCNVSRTLSVDTILENLAVVREGSMVLWPINAFFVKIDGVSSNNRGFDCKASAET